MVVVLYKVDGSPPCRAVNMVVEYLGLKVETKLVMPLHGETRKPEFIEKNPLHTIPLIEDGDLLIGDSHAIITYLVSKYGADKRGELYPNDLGVRATVDQRLYLDATTLFVRLRDILAKIFIEKAAGPSAEQIASVEEAYGFLETYLKKTSYLAADHVTLADLSCVASVSTLALLVPISDKFPALNDWLARVSAEPWYQKGNAPGLADIAAYIAKSQNKA